MSFSAYSYYVRRPSNAIDIRRPVDVFEAASVWNNAAHLADESGQVLVNWAQPTSSALGIPSLTSNAAYRLLARYGPFPATMRADGLPFEYRVRLTMFVANSGGGVAQIKVAVGPLSSMRADVSASPIPSNVFMVQTANTIGTPITLSGLLTIPTNRQTNMIGPVQTYNSTGVASSFDFPSVYVDVWAISTTATQNDPRISSLYVAEYVGNP